MAHGDRGHRRRLNLFAEQTRTTRLAVQTAFDTGGLEDACRCDAGLGEEFVLVDEGHVAFVDQYPTVDNDMAHVRW